ncbi:Putative nuclease HARBI1 [Camponotus japonicus]
MDLNFDVLEDDELDAFNLVVYGIPRNIHMRANYFEQYDELNFFRRFRLQKQSVIHVLEQIKDHLQYTHNRNNSVTPLQQLLIALRFYATNGFMITMGDYGGMDKSTVSRIVLRVSEAIASLAPIYIKLPQTQEETLRAQRNFFNIASFPRVIGAIDCTHIKIQSPGADDAEVFRNRKSYFSLNVQVVASADKKIINIVARWPGSVHDSTIFQNSNLRMLFETNHFRNCILLGDSGYPAKPYLFTPLLNTETRAQQLYNESHIRTRTIVEHTFGIWKRRFPVLAYGSRLKVTTVMIIIIATAVLHNIAQNRGEDIPPIDDEELLILENIIADDHINVNHFLNEAGNAGLLARNILINEYFNNL